MSFLNSAVQSVNAAALLLGSAGLVSRLLGVLRDRMLASHFGAGRELDIYYAAFQIPDLLSVIFLLGAGSAAILPIFQEYLAKDEEEARRLISDLSQLFITGAVLAAAVAFFIAPWFLFAVAPGFSAEERAVTLTLTRIMLLSPIFFGLSGIFSSVLQSFQRFLAYALAPILYNLGIIVGILAFVPLGGIIGLALGVILGSFLHFLIMFITARRLGFASHIPRPNLGRIVWHGYGDGVKRVVTLSLPRVLSISLTNLTFLALIAIGSTLAEGSIAVLQLAQNLYFLPIGIFGVSYAVAVFPRMSRAFIARDAKEFFNELHLGIRSILFWTLPAMTLFVVLRAHIVRVALGAGEFSWEDTRLTAAVLAALSAAMFAGALSALLIKGFYALENTWKPLFINIGASIFSVLLAYGLTVILSSQSAFSLALTSLFRVSDLPHPEVIGLGLGFSMGLLLNTSLLYFSLRRLAERTFAVKPPASSTPGVDGKTPGVFPAGGSTAMYPFPISSILKIITASLLAGATAYLVRISFSETLPLITFMQVLSQGIIAGIVGFTVYFGALFLLREEDVYVIYRTLRSRLFRVKILPAVWDGETDVHQHRV